MKNSIFIMLGIFFLTLQSCKKDYKCTTTSVMHTTDGPYENVETVNYYGITVKEKKSIEEPFTDNSPKVSGDVYSKSTVCVAK